MSTKVSGSISNDICRKASPLGGGFNCDDDSLMQILARLPAKSLVRFKSVCKSWFSLISSDYFRRLHTLCKPPPSLVFTELPSYPFCLFRQIVKISDLFYYSNQVGYVKGNNEIQRKIPYEFFMGPLDATFDVLSFCNGLLLLMHVSGDSYIYNTTTNHPEQILIHEYDSDEVSLHLLFDPLKSLHDYKIVCIREKQHHHITAFDSDSKMWRECVEGFTSGGKTCLFYLIHCDLLYCFNIVKDYVSQFIVCPLPKLADQGQVYKDMLQESSNGCLYYCAFVSDASFESAAALWELQLNGGDPRLSKWLLKYHHSVPRLPVEGVIMLAFIRETSTILIRVNQKILAYSFVDRRYKEQLLHCIPDNYFVHVNHFGDTLPLVTR